MNKHYDRVGLYHDAEDPRLFVSKRDPSFGWTINIEHPYGRATLALIMFMIVISFALIAAVGFYRR